MPALPSWLAEPLWTQFDALLPAGRVRPGASARLKQFMLDAYDRIVGLTDRAGRLTTAGG